MSENDTISATITATYGRRLGLRLADGVAGTARIKGKKIQPVCGDQVEVQRIPQESDWLIVRILRRQNQLTRPNQRGKVEVLAANLQAVVVVVANIPAPDWFIVDRYLCAAELMQAATAVVFNKSDLADLSPSSAEALNEYVAIGYLTLHCSAQEGTNIDLLQNFLSQRDAILVGQSGVGKSSLINRLTGQTGQAVATVSKSSGEGRHKTVNSVMLPLENGGAVIDSPGVRDYAPAIEDPRDAITGFREIRSAGSHCRFSNCRHLQEPGCRVKEDVASGGISARRYESYRRMLFAAERIADRF